MAVCLCPPVACLCPTAACLPAGRPTDLCRHQRGGGLMLFLSRSHPNHSSPCLGLFAVFNNFYCSSPLHGNAAECCRTCFLSFSPFSRHSACLAACRYLPHECEMPEKCTSETFFVPNGPLRQAILELGISVVI